MIEHKHKVLHEKEEKYGIPYGYFLKKIFKNFCLVGTKGTPGMVVQMFSLATLVENKCIEREGWNCVSSVWVAGCWREIGQENERIEDQVSCQSYWDNAFESE